MNDRRKEFIFVLRFMVYGARLDTHRGLLAYEAWFRFR